MMRFLYRREFCLAAMVAATSKSPYSESGSGAAPSADSSLAIELPSVVPEEWIRSILTSFHPGCALSYGTGADASFE